MELLRPHSGTTCLSVSYPGVVCSNAGVFFSRHYCTYETQDVNSFLLTSSDFVRTFLGMSTRIGRPPKSGDKAMGERLEIRVDSTEKAAYAEAAKIAGLDRSEWMRSTLNAAARRLIKGRGQRGRV